MPKSLFELEPISDAYLYFSLRKVREVEFLKDTVKPTISIQTFMTPNKNQNLLYT